jgi:hypothetical protein
VSRRVGVIAAAAALLAVPASASAAPVFTVATGTVPSASGGYPWTFTTEYRRTAGIPGVCSSLHWAWRPGEPLGSGSTQCTGATVGARFNLFAGRLNGIDVATVGGAMGDDHIRLLGLLVDRKVARIRLTTKDGVRHRLRTRLAPRGLRRRVRTRLRVAWLADTGQGFAARAVGYSRGGRRVASWRPAPQRPKAAAQATLARRPLRRGASLR